MLRPNTKRGHEVADSNAENQGDANNIPPATITSLTDEEISHHKIHVSHNISDEYIFTQPINSGASAKVYRATRKSDDCIVAIKLIPSAKVLHKRLFLNEISVLRRVDHPNIIRLLDAVVDPEYFGLILPFCCGGTLSDVISKRTRATNPLDEDNVSELVTMMLNAVAYLSSQNIAHRDLKPDNFVFADHDQTQLVLIDLADAVVIEPSRTYTDFAGTLLYVSPESFRQRRGEELLASDVWSIGVITYELMTSHTPFNISGGAMQKVMANIMMNRYDMPKHVSRFCQAFIRALLTSKISDRVTAVQALTLPFLTRRSHGDFFHSVVTSPSWSVEEEE